MNPLLIFPVYRKRRRRSVTARRLNRGRPASSPSEQPLLFLERTEAADIGNGERDTKLVPIADAEVKATVLHAETTAIGVVRHLRGGELHDALTVVVDGIEGGVPSAMVGVAKPNAPATRVGFGRKQPEGIRIGALTLDA